MLSKNKAPIPLHKSMHIIYCSKNHSIAKNCCAAEMGINAISIRYIANTLQNFSRMSHKTVECMPMKH